MTSVIFFQEANGEGALISKWLWTNSKKGVEILARITSISWNFYGSFCLGCLTYFGK